MEGTRPTSNKNQGNTVFISYAREDSDAARRLYNDLSGAGLIPWLDKESLLPGQNWEIEIRQAIESSTYFIAVLSSNSVDKRGYVQKEFKFGLELLDEVPESQIFVIPTRLDDCKIPLKLRKYQYVDLFPDWAEGVRRILRSTRVDVKYEPLPSSFNWTNLLLSIRKGKCTPLIGPEACKPWIPSADVIANRWAQEYDYPLSDSHQLSRVAQFLAIDHQDDVFPKEILSGEIKSVQTPNFSLGEFRNTPPAVLADLNLPIYITTNYDHFIEEALKSRGKQPISDFCRWSEDLVDYARDNEINIKLYDKDADYKVTSGSPLVYHLYGDIDHPGSMVLTEKDYIDFVIFLSKEEFSKGVSPLAIRKSLNSEELLFVGYTLDEAGFSLDFSVIFQTVLRSRRWGQTIRGISVQVMIPRTGSTNINENSIKKYLESYTRQIWNLNLYWGDSFTFSEDLRQQLDTSESLSRT